MLKLRAILLPILTVCMLMQPFCCHCFAQTRTMTQCADAMDDEIIAVDADSLPVENKSVCTKKSGLSTPKIDLDRLQLTTCVWRGSPSDETILPCFTSVDADILSRASVRCPAWLRFSVLLI